MASTEGLVPITRAFLASYYDKHPFTPLSTDVSRLSSQIRSMANDLLSNHPPNPNQGFFLSFIFFLFLLYYVRASLLSFIPGESELINEADRQPPHKIDENMWKNREYIEETIFLLETSNWPEPVMYICNS